MTFSLKPEFNRARRHKSVQHYYTLPLQDVANMFALLNGKFSTKHNYWPGVYKPLKQNFWNIRGHTLAYFTNLKEKIVLEGDPKDPDNDRTYPASPGILYSEHYKFYKKTAFGLVIQPRITDRKLLDTTPPVFALYGIYDSKTEAFQVHKMMIPVFKGLDQTGSQTLEGDALTQEVVERALLFGCLCTEEMLRARELKAKRNWDQAQTHDLKGNPPPWRRPGAKLLLTPV